VAAVTTVAKDLPHLRRSLNLSGCRLRGNRGPEALEQEEEDESRDD
jgi:hypothetical protein